MELKEVNPLLDFKPITLEITLRSADEARAFYHTIISSEKTIKNSTGGCMAKPQGYVNCNKLWESYYEILKSRGLVI